MIELLSSRKLTFRDAAMLSTERSFIKIFHQVLKKEKNGNVRSCMLQNLTSMEPRGTEASLRVSKLLAEATAPYSHTSLINSCMLEVVKTVFPDQKDIVDKLKLVLLSQQTCTRRKNELVK